MMSLDTLSVTRKAWTKQACAEAKSEPHQRNNCHTDPAPSSSAPLLLLGMPPVYLGSIRDSYGSLGRPWRYVPDECLKGLSTCAAPEA